MAKKYSNIDLSKYSKGYQASQDVLNAQKLKQQAENAVKNHGAFKYGNQAALDAAMDAVTNRKAFSYDLNADALYQQYKDQYSAQGKMAMMDTMGQAAALTGGYGNSYAATVGNQAYQNHLQSLNNIIPDLYNLALATYQAEGDRLKDNYGILLDDRNTAYGMWADERNRLVEDRGYYADNYNNAYSQDYGMWNDNRNYDTSQYWNEYQANYQKERDAIADAQWQKEFNLAVSRANGGGGGSGDKTSNLKTPTAEMLKEARVIYKRDGMAALNDFALLYPGYDTDYILSYATSGSSTNQNRVANRDYANGATGRDKFDSGVRNSYSKRQK